MQLLKCVSLYLCIMTIQIIPFYSTQQYMTLFRHFSMSHLILFRTVVTDNGTCPLLSVQPSRGLVDEKFQIVIMNLLPNQEVTIYCLHQSEDKDFWQAFGHYISDEDGIVTGAWDSPLHDPQKSYHSKQESLPTCTTIQKLGVGEIFFLEVY